MDETPSPTRWQLACARTCRNALCTGKGDVGRWAHRCQLDDSTPELAPVFTSHQPLVSTVPSPSERRDPHDYGPHDPATAPTTVEILAGGVRHGDRVTRYPSEQERPLPAALVRQRAAVNQRAHDQSPPAGSRGPARVLLETGSATGDGPQVVTRRV